MYKISQFIVRQKILFFFLFLVAIIFSIIAMKQVKVNYDLTKYLPDDSETKIALDVMEEEFGLNGVANVIIVNITVEEAISLKDDISEIPGVLNASFENNDQYYKEGNALIKITLEEGDYAISTEEAVYDIKEILENYEVEMSGSSVYNVNQKDDVLREMTMILAIAVPIIVLILFIAANSYAEILVFGIVVGTSVLLNKGSNLFLGEISYVTDSVAIVLQLALAMDYSIILLHRFEEEKMIHAPQEAIIHALKNSITSIGASSLTTIFGLVSIMFMKFTIGYDIGIVLAKSIICSLLSVFLLMPGVLLVFNRLIEKTRHKKFIPDMNFIHKYVIKTRFLMPFVFIVIVFLAFTAQKQNTFLFSLNNEKESQYTELFGKTNTLAIIVPKGNQQAEQDLIEYIKQNPYINNASGIETLGLRSQLNVEEFSSKFGIDPSLALGVYGYYMNEKGDALEEIEINSMLLFMIENKELFELTDEQIQNMTKVNTLITLKNQPLDYETFASTLGLEKAQAQMIYAIYDMSSDELTYEMASVLTFMIQHATELGLDEAQTNLLTKTKQLIDLQDTELTSQVFGNMLNMSESESYKLYTLYEMSLDEQKYGIIDLLQFMFSNKESLNLSLEQVATIEQALGINQYKDALLAPEQFSQIMGMDVVNVNQLYYMYNNEHQTNVTEIEFETLIQYINLRKELLNLSESEANQLNRVTLLLNNTSLRVSEFSNTLDISQEEVVGLYGLYSIANGYQVDSHSPKTILNFMNDNNVLLALDETKVAEIQSLLNLFAVSHLNISPSAFANTLGIDKSNAIGIYAAYALNNQYEVGRVELNTLVDYIINNHTILQLTTDQITQMNGLKSILDASGLHLTPQDLSTLLQIEIDEVEILYGVYTAKVETPSFYLLDLLDFMSEKGSSIGLTNEQKTQITESKQLINDAFNQFESDEYARILFNINLKPDDELAFNLIYDLRTNLSEYYDEYYVLGDSANVLDIKDSFNQDVLIVSMISIISIFIILTLSFKSIVVPLLLILVIQGSIWINFSFSAIMDNPIIFMGYIMVTAIQMGATIDYAIVMTERYKGFRETENKFDAVKNAITVSLPTLMTSGGILIVAGFCVGLISSVTSIKDLGILMGRGALVSCLLVLFILPQLLVLFDRIVVRKRK